MDNCEELWWKKYRKRPYKPAKISTQLIFWKTLKDISKEYIEQCSFDIIRRVGDRSASKISRFFTMLILGFATVLLLYYLHYTWSTILSTPLVITMQSSTYPISLIDFPAVAVCNSNRISRKALEELAIILKRADDLETSELILIKHIKNDNATPHRNELILEKIKTSFVHFGRLINFSWDNTLIDHLFVDDVSSADFEYLRPRTLAIMEQLAPKCEDFLLTCLWAGDVKNCSELFTMRRTSRGHCCVFNQILEKHSGGKPRKTIGEPKRQVEPGPKHGLTVFMDPLIEDYAYTIDPTVGFHVMMYDPKQYADPTGGKLIRRIVEPNTALYLELQSVKQIAAEEVRKYSANTRGCLFKDEIPELYNDMYTYSSCILDCKIHTVKQACKCTPYFYPVDVNVTVLCTMNELRCLNKHREKLLYLHPIGDWFKDATIEAQDSMYCPRCLPDCEFTKHVSRSFWTPLELDHKYQSKQLRRYIGGNVNITNKSLLTIYQPTSDGILDRLDVVSYWFEILSNVAGFTGMVVGLCFISFAEILFMFCVRLFQQFHINYKYYKTNKMYI